MNNQVPTIKCIVWDLDNTLWNGTLLEEPRVAVEDATRMIVDTLDQRGILQSVASKNDHDLAWARLKALDMDQYFIAPQIGWMPKSHGINEIANELNFALSAVAFIDDQPEERAEVNFHLPDVRCYDRSVIGHLVELPEFNPRVVTTDARHRREMYRASARRKLERDEFVGADEAFIRSLNLTLTITRAEPDDLARVEELTLRTSQMNATGIHYSESDLSQMRDSTEYEVFIATLVDRFGSYGAIGIVLLHRRDLYWHIKLLATSCRVVSLGIGSVILEWLNSSAAKAGVHLVADFRRNERNRIMEIAYRFSGFSDSNCSCFADLRPEQNTVLFHVIPEIRQHPTVEVIASDLE